MRLPYTSFVALLHTAPHGKDLSNLRLGNPNPQKPLRGQPPLSIIRRLYARYLASTPRYYVVFTCPAETAGLEPTHHVLGDY